MSSIDALFSSKTRVKLLHLFFNNPGRSFYVREITRLVDEQINSVRRELANLVDVGVIESSNSDNKLFYQVSQRYQFYKAFREIFAGVREGAAEPTSHVGKLKPSVARWQELFDDLDGVRVVVAAGSLVRGSASSVDLLIVGRVDQTQVGILMSSIEKEAKRTLNYTMMPYDEFYYRLSVRDKFVADILTSKHVVIVDVDKTIGK